MNNHNQVKYIGFGSPLMDMIADVDEGLIKKHNLILNQTIHRKLKETPAIQCLEKEAQITWVPGGCSYNTIRIFNWMLTEEEKTNHSSALIGSIGDDNYGKLYKELVQKENIVPLFEEFSHDNTGICCVYCYDRDRGHITDLGASILVSEGFVNSNFDLVKNAKLIYTELFILKHKQNIVYQLAEEGCKDDKFFGFNIPSFFFIETFIKEITDLIQYADIIFTNAAECTFLTKMMGLKGKKNNQDDLGGGEDEEQESLSLGCEFLAKYAKKNVNKRRVVVVTWGPNPAYVCQYDHKRNRVTFKGLFPPNEIPEENLIDTNGAGDGFAGGFLSRYVLGKSLNEAVSAGHWAAAQVIQERGCQFPSKCLYKY